MKSSSKSTTREQLSTLLNIGTIASGSLLLLGLVVMISHGEALANVSQFERTEASPVRTLLADLRATPGRTLTTIGVMLLIALPAARTGLAAYSFAKEGHRIMFGLAVVVAGVLVWGLVGRY